MSNIVRIQKKYLQERQESRRAKAIKAEAYLDNVMHERERHWEKKRFPLTFLETCVII